MEHSRPHRRHKMLLSPVWPKLCCQLLKVQRCCLAYAEDLQSVKHNEVCCRAWHPCCIAC